MMCEVSRALQDKGKAKQEELGHLDLLLNAAEELHRSSSSQGGDDAMDYEPSTAGSPPGEMTLCDALE